MIDFKINGDERGSLVALEYGRDFPFDIKRVYYIWGTSKNAVRGKHAHVNLEQVVICMSGSCDFILDNGQGREVITLDNPAKGLFIKGLVWREFTNFSSGCVVMVLANAYYDENDYIRSYEEFKKIATEMQTA